MSFTYNPATPVGKVRLLIADTDLEKHLFEDEELTTFLQMNSNKVVSAAAMAYETMARDRSKLAKVVSQNSFRTEKYAATEFLALAKNLRDSGRTTLQTAEMGSGDSGEYLDSYRPTWREIDAPPIVE